MKLVIGFSFSFFFFLPVQKDLLNQLCHCKPLTPQQFSLSKNNIRFVCDRKTLYFNFMNVPHFF